METSDGMASRLDSKVDRASRIQMVNKLKCLLIGFDFLTLRRTNPMLKEPFGKMGSSLKKDSGSDPIKSTKINE